MQKKICPICDTPLSNGNYCSVCRKVVRKPLIRNQDYYLNELRPEEKNHIQTKQIQVNPGQTNYNPKNSSSSGNRRSKSVYVPKTKQRSGAAVAFFVALFLLIFVWVLVLAPGKMWERSDSQDIFFYQSNDTEGIIGIPVPDDNGYYDGNEYNYGDEYYYGDEENQEVNYDRYELTDEEVRKEGKACNDYGHLSVPGEAVISAMREVLDTGGYELEEEYYSGNFAYVYDDGTKYTEYCHDIYYDLPPFDEAAVDDSDASLFHIMASFDTVTDEIHFMQIYSDDMEMVILAAKEFTACMDGADASISLDMAELEKELREMSAGVDGQIWIDGDEWELYAAKGQYGAVVNVSANEYD